jgi:hypothetical protein
MAHLQMVSNNLVVSFLFPGQKLAIFHQYFDKQVFFQEQI